MRPRRTSPGAFALPELAIGTYRVEVTLGGYRTYANRTELAVGQDLWLDVPLELAVAQAVEVTAPIRPDRSRLGGAGHARRSTPGLGLPLDGRNFLELALLAPGTVSGAAGIGRSVRGDFSFSVNGGREDANAYLLDGVYNVDPKLGTPGVGRRSTRSASSRS